MQNIQTTPATVTNKETTTASVALSGLSTSALNNQEVSTVGITTSLQSLGFWKDFTLTWTEAELTWADVTDVTSITNL